MDIAGRSVRSISHEDIASSSDVFGLESADARVLGETTIEWARWVDSGELTVPESGLLLDYDKQSLEDRLDLLNEPTNPYVDLFLSILSKFRDPETLHYVLALLHQFLAADVGLKTNFQQSTLRPGYMDVLLGIAKRPAVGEYGKCKSLQIISLLLRAGVTDSLENKVAHARLLGFFGLVNQELATAFGGFSHLLPGAEQDVKSPHVPALSDGNGRLVLSLLDSLKQVLMKPVPAECDEQTLAVQPQHIYMEGLQGVRVLTTVIERSMKNTQVLYAACMCVWVMSFNERLLGRLRSRALLRVLVQIVNKVDRLKVVRIIYGAFANMQGAFLGKLNDREVQLSKQQQPEPADNSNDPSSSSSSSSESASVSKSSGDAAQDAKTLRGFAEDLIGLQLHRITDTLLERKWKDKDRDVVSDMELVKAKLAAVLVDLSSFEMYVAEVSAGQLTDSPVHSEGFWRDNVLLFEEKNFWLIKELGTLLDVVDDDTTLEMCVYDFGEFARFHPDGRRVIQKLELKAKIMKCMDHDSAQVRRAALLCVQKLLIRNWEQLGSSRGGIAALHSGS